MHTRDDVAMMILSDSNRIISNVSVPQVTWISRRGFSQGSKTGPLLDMESEFDPESDPESELEPEDEPDMEVEEPELASDPSSDPDLEFDSEFESDPELEPEPDHALDSEVESESSSDPLSIGIIGFVHVLKTILSFSPSSSLVNHLPVSMGSESWGYLMSTEVFPPSTNWLMSPQRLNWNTVSPLSNRYGASPGPFLRVSKERNHLRSFDPK